MHGLYIYLFAVSGGGGGLLPGGTWFRGVCSGGGVVSQHALRQTPPREQND